MRIFALCLFAVALAPASQVPTGTQVQIRLTQAVNTKNAKVGQPVEAVLIAPVLVDNRIAVAAGVKVTGHIKELKAAVQPDDQAVLTLVFDQMSDASGARARIEARVASVDNARES